MSKAYTTQTCQVVVLVMVVVKFVGSARGDAAGEGRGMTVRWVMADS